MDGQDAKVSGWKEWLALPEIGIPGIEASIDTSSEVSTLQASFVEHYRRDGELWVRFGVNPLSQRNDIRIVCQAPVKKHHTFPFSDSGEETLFVIESSVEIGGSKTLTELVLRQPEEKEFSLRLGRNTLNSLGLLVNPQRVHQLGAPDESLYSNQLKAGRSNSH